MPDPTTSAVATGPAETETDFSRLFGFSDGVFSIAITLLAFDVKLPELPDGVDDALLVDALWSLAGKTAIYAQSFVVIGLFWMVHRQMFRMLERFDSRLVWLNHVFLLFLAFLPVPSAVLGRFPHAPSAVRFYCASVALASTALLLEWLYASHGHRLIDAGLSPYVIGAQAWRSVLTIAACLASALVAEWRTDAALELLFGYTVLSFPLGWAWRAWLSRRVAARA